jgi:hypothetical protein
MIRCGHWAWQANRRTRDTIIGLDTRDRTGLGLEGQSIRRATMEDAQGHARRASNQQGWSGGEVAGGGYVQGPTM